MSDPDGNQIIMLEGNTCDNIVTNALTSSGRYVMDVISGGASNGTTSIIANGTSSSF